MDQLDDNQKLMLLALTNATGALLRDQLGNLQQQVGQVNQVAQQANQARPIGNPKITALETTDALAWIEFRTMFLTALPLMNWNLDQQKQNLRFYCQKEAGQAVGNVDLRLNDPAFTIENLLDAYEARFLSTSATAAAIQEYFDAHQKADQSITAWHSHLHHLHRRAYPNVAANDRNRDPILMNKFKAGLSDPQVRTAAHASFAPTYDDLLTMVQEAMSSIKMSQRFPGGSINAIGSGPSGESSGPTIAAVGQPGPSRETKCHACEQLGHYWRDCTTTKRVQRLLASLRKSRPSSTYGGPRRTPARTPFKANKSNPGRSGGRAGNSGPATKPKWNPRNREGINSMTTAEEEQAYEEDQEGEDDSYLDYLGHEENGEDEGNEEGPC